MIIKAISKHTAYTSNKTCDNWQRSFIRHGWSNMCCLIVGLLLVKNGTTQCLGIRVYWDMLYAHGSQPSSVRGGGQTVDRPTARVCDICAALSRVGDDINSNTNNISVFIAAPLDLLRNTSR